MNSLPGSRTPKESWRKVSRSLLQAILRTSRSLGSLIYARPLVCRDIRRRLFFVGDALRDKTLENHRFVIGEKVPFRRGSNVFERDDFGHELKDKAGGAGIAFEALRQHA